MISRYQNLSTEGVLQGTMKLAIEILIKCLPFSALYVILLNALHYGFTGFILFGPAYNPWMVDMGLSFHFVEIVYHVPSLVGTGADIDSGLQKFVFGLLNLAIQHWYILLLFRSTKHVLNGERHTLLEVLSFSYDKKLWRFILFTILLMVSGFILGYFASITLGVPGLVDEFIVGFAVLATVVFFGRLVITFPYIEFEEKPLWESLSSSFKSIRSLPGLGFTFLIILLDAAFLVVLSFVAKYVYFLPAEIGSILFGLILTVGAIVLPVLNSCLTTIIYLKKEPNHVFFDDEDEQEDTIEDHLVTD